MTADVDHPVIRAHRIEIVDGSGRIRAVVGDLSGSAQHEEVFGVALVGPDGRHRAWLSLDDNGATLAFDRTGNAVLELAVVDGRPTLGWRVDDDGGVVMRVNGMAP